MPELKANIGKNFPQSGYIKSLLPLSVRNAKKNSFFWRIHDRLLWELGRDVCDFVAYKKLLHAASTLSETPQEKELNPELSGYPRNHDYSVLSGRFVPGTRLFSRWRILSELFDSNMDSFLDVGSSKGFFVFGAALRTECKNACGIDLHEPFIKTSEKVKNLLGIDKANFHLAALDEIDKNPEKFGAPFHTIMIINTYHYLYWGSGLVDKSFNSHDEIMQTLAKICSKKVIFSNPLEVHHATGEIKKRAQGKDHNYTTAAFMEAASKYFNISRAGSLGQTRKRPLLILEKK